MNKVYLFFVGIVLVLVMDGILFPERFILEKGKLFKDILLYSVGFAIGYTVTHIDR